ncbi:twin-arginine translocation pathway signal protein [Aliidiomarina shirensis]|uniref:Twin-arginine translocation pathway signal protein n=1 Tax=Aliidiomarina shirensis TaxID=1048642 RepID=A0A432WQH8_9GAMM|nr:twin-arginine translocation pathway signal protein [Aliidiomarina shirensis]RUO36018.1 twin-arginine translocation pathway signal protein [Aliidiomarina shirensis]
MLTNKSDENHIDKSRRGFLKLSGRSAFALAAVGTVVSVVGYTGFRWQQRSNAESALNFSVLRPQDIMLFGALLPVVLGPNPTFRKHLTETSNDTGSSVVENTLLQLDSMLAHSSPAMQKQIRDLVDLLTFSATQGFVSGYWGNWQNASLADIETFLQRWRNSKTQLFRFGYQGICQLCQMAWYGRPESWADIGYPGIPAYLRGSHAGS